MIYYDSIAHLWGYMRWLYFTKITTFNSLKPTDLECGDPWPSGFQAKTLFSTQLFPVLTVMHGGRGKDEA